jgi:hypothetical protein
MAMYPPMSNRVADSTYLTTQARDCRHTPVML